MLEELYEEISSASNEQKLAGDSIRIFNFYTTKILSGELTSVQELRARFGQKFKRDASLADEQGNTVFDQRGYSIFVPDFEQLKLTDPEQRILLEELYELTNTSGTSDEVKNLLRVCIKEDNVLAGKDNTALTRLRSILAERNDPLSSKIEDFISRFDITKRRLALRQDFYSTLNSETVEEAFRVLGLYEGQDVSDQVLLKQLGSRALGVRRARVVGEFASTLASPTRDFDQALQKASVLAGSSVDEDRRAAGVLIKVLYKLETASYRDQVKAMIALDKDPSEIYQFIDSLPIRPSVDDFNYLQSQINLKERVKDFYLGLSKITRLKQANELRASFASADIDQVLTGIEDLPEETGEEIALKAQLFTLYKSQMASSEPSMFDQRFAEEIRARIESKLKQVFISPELGKNKEAFRYLKRKFDRIFRPLIGSYEDDPRTRGEVQQILGQDETKLKFVQKLSDLEKQRPLTDIERAYLQSVQLLTLFNPYLVASLEADMAVTSEYLKHYFDSLSQETSRELKDGDYIPLIQVGTGPNGLAALGEIVRNNAILASQMLVVDSGEQPGGPFAIPQGPAWSLNSANSRGERGYVLPEKPGSEEIQTVRAYGSPMRWYPGERIEGLDIRTGSINTTVDYLLTPDELSQRNYPTNEELQLILALQTALLASRLSLRTTLLKVEPNPNKDEKGDKIATLKIRGKDGGERVIYVKTDAILSSTGLGEPSYGFRLEGSRAEKVLDAVKDSKKFPKLSTTLEAFKALTERAKSKEPPGKVLVIWGSGNSTDTLLEFIGRIFQGDNPKVREVTKIYVLAEKDLSSRPRYSLISDLKPRNGQGNLVEQIRVRVSDVDFATSSGNPEDRKLVIYDDQGNIIADKQGNPIFADAAIAASGFRPRLDSIFEDYLDGGSVRDEGADAPLKSLTLPTNPDVAVAEYFKKDSNIVVLGTASKPRFKSLEKLEQLPVEASQALLRNGAENAVAIGFRAPDTQAAINIWLNSRNINLEPKVDKQVPQISFVGDNPFDTKVQVEVLVDPNNLQVPDNLQSDDLLLSPLLAYNIAQRFQLDDKFNGSVEFELTYLADEAKFNITYIQSSVVKKISSEFLGGLILALSDEYFQRYALSALGKRRRDPKLSLNISFLRGKVNPKNTFVQTI